MFRKLILRSFHTGVILNTAKTEKSLLAKLRNKTGYAIGNCKKALVMHNDDYEKALAWLNEQAQAEGWRKAEKLQGRQAAQGLIGLFRDKTAVTLVEVNCETDFVARNKEYKDLVSSIANVCHTLNAKNLVPTANGFIKNSGNCDELIKVPIEDKLSAKKSLGDLIALKIGLLGENMTLRRVLSLKVADDVCLGCYTHPVNTNSSSSHNDGFLFGKYGAVVVFKKSGTESVTNLTADQCGKQLAQHVIGMNPQSIGPPFEPPVSPDVPSTEEIENETKNTEENDDSEQNISSSVAKDDEARMLYQEFLSDPAITVGEFVHHNGIEVLDFTRFECGETS